MSFNSALEQYICDIVNNIVVSRKSAQFRRDGKLYVAVTYDTIHKNGINVEYLFENERMKLSESQLNVLEHTTIPYWNSLALLIVQPNDEFLTKMGIKYGFFSIIEEFELSEHFLRENVGRLDWEHVKSWYGATEFEKFAPEFKIELQLKGLI